jgi:hypothetical protein
MGVEEKARPLRRLLATVHAGFLGSHQWLNLYE